MRGHCRHQWGGELRDYGYRMTRPRQAILDVLGKTADHLSAEDIYLSVREVYPNIGLTTVYRTLELLAEKGWVVKFEFGQGKAKYELAEKYGSKGHHHHLVCNACSRVIDYSDFMDDEVQFLTRTEKGLSRKYGFQITGHQIRFSGYCDQCRGD